MTDTTQLETPEWYGSTARATAFFPLMMAVYMVFYAAWAPFAWPLAGSITFVVVGAAAALCVRRGIHQIRHAKRYRSIATAENDRLGRTMGILNSVTHPIWMLGGIVLGVLGEGRWFLPLMVFVIGAHFLPMAQILNRTIDYLLGPIAMGFAIAAAVLGSEPTVPWIDVYAVAGLGGAITTFGYALYMIWNYRRTADAAGVTIPRGRPLGQ